MATGSKLGRASRAASLARDAIGIVGHGAFATALASMLPGRDLTAVMFTDDDDLRRDINKRHQNPAHLPGVTLAKRVVAISDPSELAEVCRLLIVAVSSRKVVRVIRTLGPFLDGRHTVAHAIGGLAGDDRRVSQIIRSHSAVTRVAALAGPALAHDLVARRSAALVVASDDPAVAAEVKAALHQPPVLRIYQSADLVGVELAATLAAAVVVTLGVADGLAVGHGPRTVLLTRAVAELATVVAASGGDLRTAYGMAGLGNLLSRSSPEARGQSRDYQVGLALGRGEAAPSEGSAGTRALATARRLTTLVGVAAPILHTIDDIASGRLGLDLATDRLASLETDRE
jgi:glycerol-3-phosphate dehydrogenase (NAD(P)+)